MRRELAALPTPDPQRDEGHPTSARQEERRRQLLQLLAEIEKRINEENARPKKRYISPSTREEVYAIYYDALRRKIEERGTRNFPENRGRKLYGELTMNVTVDAEGRVVEAEVVRSSNSQVLDRRAVAIVARPRPFGRFTPAMRRNADQIVITSRFRFTRDEGLETSLERIHERADAWIATPSWAIRSTTASRPSSTPRFARQTGQALDYGAPALRARTASPPRCDAFAAEGGRGCNVTVPFKFEAARWPGRVSRAPRAQAPATRCASMPTAGSPTTPTASACVRDIERNAGIALAGRRVLLIGAGGAAAGVLGPLIDGASGRGWSSPTARAEQGRRRWSRAMRRGRRPHGVHGSRPAGLSRSRLRLRHRRQRAAPAACTAPPCR